MDDTSWRRLFSKIQEGNVVPIIGSRLLVGADGEGSLQAQIAKRLINDHGKEFGEPPLPPFRELNEAVSRLKGTVDLQKLYDFVHDAIRDITKSGNFAVPAPIRQMAQIADLRLFVTLTPDDLLARCLRDRCKVNEIVHSPYLPTSEGEDLPPDWRERPGEVYLLYLFGKSRSAPMFAIHDEDVLEYAHNVIAHGSQVPSRFLCELQQRNLLLVGCNFPDWLSRFFLRATNQKRLLSETYRSAWLIEQLQPEEGFTCFLKSFSKDTEILSESSPVEFVGQLHQRWMAEHGGGSHVDSIEDEAVPCETLFFISYSRKTDLSRAESLYNVLLGMGVTKSEVWFDRRTLEPGQNYQRRILDGIRGCRYFLPLLSQAANIREEAFVFREWREANDRGQGMNRDFIFPVILDAEYRPERYTAEPVSKWAEFLDFGHAPEGEPNPQLKNTLTKLLRKARWGNERS